jgi:4-coumarate--CoA ligase (photoactive yellow protein activation family)
MASNPVFSRRSLVRIVLDLVAEELQASRAKSAAALGRAGWSEATRLDGAGLDLDSLERMDAASALNEFFHLYEYGAEDHLLALPSVGEWCDLVEQSLRATGTRLTFRTSGSTGEPKRCTHAVADLMSEAEGWARLLGSVSGVVALVPAHHIYGAIFTALLPDVLGVDAAEPAGGAEAVRSARPGALVVGTPTNWAYLSRSLLAVPPGVAGVTSTAPMPHHLAYRLRGQRLDRLVEVYGSSETAGLAWRDREDAAYALLSCWARAADDAVARADGAPMLLPDRVRWLDERCFAVEGRRDGAVQIGGTNVFPSQVRDQLLAHAGVADAAVRLDERTGRLKAFVVPAGGVDPDRLVVELDGWCGARLRSVERPRRFAAGRALPVNAMGKPADW